MTTPIGDLLLMYGVGTDKATHAVVGSHPVYGAGILAWTRCEIHAHILRKALEKEGEVAVKTVEDINTFLESEQQGLLDLILFPNNI